MLLMRKTLSNLYLTPQLRGPSDALAKRTKGFSVPYLLALFAICNVEGYCSECKQHSTMDGAGVRDKSYYRVSVVAGTTSRFEAGLLASSGSTSLEDGPYYIKREETIYTIMKQ